MITPRCTKKLLTYDSFKPEPEDSDPTSALGDWYANIIGSATGDQIVFVNYRQRDQQIRSCSTCVGAAR